MTLEEARAFIAASSWTPARQPLGGPHEYTVRSRGADPDGWWSFARYIRDHGSASLGRCHPRGLGSTTTTRSSTAGSTGAPVQAVQSV